MLSLWALGSLWSRLAAMEGKAGSCAGSKRVGCPNLTEGHTRIAAREIPGRGRGNSMQNEKPVAAMAG